MDTTGVFRVDPATKVLQPLNETDLAAHGFKERYDLQEWITTHPEVLGEELLIIAKECNAFDRTNERADLVALDREGNLVIIELKRDDSGTDVHWQAIKYASYFSRAKGSSLVGLFHDYCRDLSDDEALQRVLSFTQLDDVSALNHKQRIILASHRFAREATSAVLWLRDSYGVDIRCVQLTPFHDAATGAFYLQSRTIIPVPGTEDFVIDVGLPEASKDYASRGATRSDDVSLYMASVADAADRLIDESIRPNRRSRWAGTWGNLRYYKLWYSHLPWSNHEFSYQTHIVSHSSGRREYAVKFEVNIDSALAHGLTTGDVDTLRSAVARFAGDNGPEPK